MQNRNIQELSFDTNYLPIDAPIFHYFDGEKSHNKGPYPFNTSTPNQTRPWVIRFILCIQATLEKKYENQKHQQPWFINSMHP